MLQNKKLQLIEHGNALHRDQLAKRATSSEESVASPFP
jgi:hypothetical protein